MMEVSKPLSAGHIESYYGKEYAAATSAYYSQHLQGEWHGILAAQEGLTGPVLKEHHMLLAQGRHPITGEVLLSYKGQTPRAGYDITFNAPKTVSVTALVAGDGRILIAHYEAVRATLDQLEKYTQVKMGGNHAPQLTGKWIVAMFQHDTARPVNGYPAPHLHTHAVLFNVSEDASGKARALQPSELYRIQAMGTSIYQSELAHRLRSLGYQLERGPNYAPDIKGYTSAYIESQSPRTEQIETEMANRGVTGREAKNIVSHSVREGKLDLTKDAVLAMHKAQAALHGDQPQRVYAEARERGPRHTPIKEGLPEKAVRFAVNRNIERSAVIEEFEIIRDALRYGGWRLKVGAVREEIARRKEAPGFSERLLPVQHVRTNAPGERFTTPEMVAMERGVLAAVANGRGLHQPLSEETSRATFREARSHLNDGQLWVLWKALHSGDRLIALNGGAGTGKTTMLAEMRASFVHHGYEVIGLAPTSGATKEMQKAGVTATTLQKHLLFDTDRHGPRFYFLDESSLASTKQVYELLTNRMQAGDRILFVGDTRQHQSIEAGRIFAEMQQAGLETFTLNTIVRQKEEALRQAVYYFSKGQTEYGVSSLAQADRIREVQHRQQRFDAIARNYVQQSQLGSTVIVTPDNRSRRELNETVRGVLREEGFLEPKELQARVLITRQEITSEDRKAALAYTTGDQIRFHAASKTLGLDKGAYVTVIDSDKDANTVTVQKADGKLFTYDPSRHYGVTLYRPEYRNFAVGDTVQFTTVWKDRGIGNRDFGKVTHLDDKGRIAVQLRDTGRTIRWNLKDMPHLEHGYAGTSHSLEGTTVDYSLVHVDTGDSRVRPLLDKSYNYVSVSRGRLDTTVYTDNANALVSTLDHWNQKAKALPGEEILQYRQQPVMSVA